MDLIKREDAIKAVSEPFDRKYWHYTTRSIRDTVKALKDIPSAENKGENATRCYEFLKTKLGEDIVDSKKEFESWFDRMVWHVKECDRLAREPKQGEWIFQECNDEFYGRAYECSICGVAVVGNHHNFCPNCGARMVK